MHHTCCIINEYPVNVCVAVLNKLLSEHWIWQEMHCLEQEQIVEWANLNEKKKHLTIVRYVQSHQYKKRY